MWHRKRKTEPQPLDAAELRQAILRWAEVQGVSTPQVQTTLEVWLAEVEAAMHTGSVVVDEYGTEAIGMSVALLHQTPEGAPHDTLECLTDQLLHEGVPDA